MRLEFLQGLGAGLILGIFIGALIMIQWMLHKIQKVMKDLSQNQSP